MKLTIQQALQNGVKAHKEGKIREADQYYTAILKAQPKHADANHNMGVLAVGLGKVDEAIPYFEKAIEANQTIDQFWLSYLDALLKIDSISDFRIMLDKAKNQKVNSRDLNALEKKLILKLKHPSHDQLHCIIELYNKKDLSKALNKAETLKKNFGESYILFNLLGVINAALDNFKDSIKYYKKAIKLNPNESEFYYNLANLFYRYDLFDDAIFYYYNTIKINPNHLNAIINLAKIYQSYGELDKAQNKFMQAMSINAKSVLVLNNYAYFLIGRGEAKRAVPFLQESLKLEQKNSSTLNILGVAFQDIGNLKKAIECFKSSITKDKLNADSHLNLSKLLKYKKNDWHFDLLKNLHKKNNLDTKLSIYTSIALSKAYEDIGDYKNSYKFLKRGNTERKINLPYNIEEDKKLFNLIKNKFPVTGLKKIRLDLEEKLIPIFIVGMPRSGTTLVEQIISSHSEICGAGELDYIERFGKGFFLGDNQINSESLNNFRSAYLEKLMLHSNKKKYVTDKMPLNFRFIGLLILAFPESKIFHVNRDPKATCWSNYKNYFPSTGLPYTHDLKDIVSYFNLYKDLMDFWKVQFSNYLYEVNYENLTQNQETEIRNIVDFLNLNWQEECLYPENNQRSIPNGSQQQVRKKIYSGSSKEWLNFENFIGDCFNNLNFKN